MKAEFSYVSEEMRDDAEAVLVYLINREEARLLLQVLEGAMDIMGVS